MATGYKSSLMGTNTEASTERESSMERASTLGPMDLSLRATFTKE